MAGSSTVEAGVGRSLDCVSNGRQQCQSSEALAEWRSSEQLENGTPSTSPPYWDSDDDDCGPKPSELYGKYTWKIDKFSQINKRELRSNAFDVGGYKWYILVYPQGCDVCNHLSLFLCVGNHDKLLPGWSHFAQFTIAVVNKDPKKSKHSDTLHRFWKKEHDWGWKKFMELSKVLDGFIDADTLVIKAQVQVIRERADRPFSCLDYQYRRELIRVYLTNVEQLCRRFVEERRGKLMKLIEDKARWSSFCAFWSGMDLTAKRLMIREKKESILTVVVKHFFIEKEVTSTLVMESLYSGLKALEGQTNSKKDKRKLNLAEEVAAPVVRMEKDMFVLVDDVLLLLERVATEPLPPKDEKGPQNRMKDGSPGEDFNKDSIERDERRLTELGRRTIETFVLSHIFSSKIEVAYQDVVALKRQEELIREEEAAWMVASEQKSKRGLSEKEKKSKKKKSKQKRNNRRTKDKGRSEKSSLTVQDNIEPETLISERDEYYTEEAVAVSAKSGAPEDNSDLSDSIDCVSEVLQPEDRDPSPVSWGTDTSEANPFLEPSSRRVISYSAVQNGLGSRAPSVMDDSSSTCSTDSVPSVVTNGHCKVDNKSQKSQSRRRKQKDKATSGQHESARRTCNGSSDRVSNVGKLIASRSSMTAATGSQATISSLNGNGMSGYQRLEKDEDPQKRKGKVDVVNERPSQVRSVPPSPSSTSKDPASMAQSMSERKTSTGTDFIPALKQVPGGSDQDTERLKQDNESAQPMNSSGTDNMVDRSVPLKPLEKLSPRHIPAKTEKASEFSDTTQKPENPQLPVMPRPLSAPLAPGPRPTAPVVSIVHCTPFLARSVSAAGRLGPEPSSASQSSYIPQSYRNAIIGNHGAGISNVYPQSQSPGISMSSSHSYSQPPAEASAFSPECSERKGSNSIRPSCSFGKLNHDLMGNGTQRTDNCSRNSSLGLPSDHPSIFSDIRNFDDHPSNSSRILSSDRPSVLSEIRNFDAYPLHLSTPKKLPAEDSAGTSGRQSNAVMADEFPHLDIINDLLDDDLGIKIGTSTSSSFRSFHNRPQHLNRQFGLPGEIGMSNGIGPPMNSCRFERTQSYQEDGHLQEYVFPMGPSDSTRDMLHHSDSGPGTYPDQWHVASSNDPSFLDPRDLENGSYAYHIPPDCANLACGINGYGVFRPPSGF